MNCFGRSQKIECDWENSEDLCGNKCLDSDGACVCGLVARIIVNGGCRNFVNQGSSRTIVNAKIR